jgi:hypothetical protein
MKIGRAMGAINSKIILTLVFALVVTPFAVVSRLFGRDPLRRRFRDSTLNTYRVPRGARDRSHFTHQF